MDNKDIKNLIKFRKVDKKEKQDTEEKQELKILT